MSAPPPGYPAGGKADAGPPPPGYPGGPGQDQKGMFGGGQPAVGYPQQGFPGGAPPQGYNQGFPPQQNWQQPGPYGQGQGMYAQPYGQPPPQHYQGYPPPPPPQGMYVQHPGQKPQGGGAESCLMACLAATYSASRVRPEVPKVATYPMSFVELFKVLDSKDLLQPGRSEEEINKDIYDLAASQFGTKKFWHPNLVRTGANSILPIHQRATPLSLAADDILYIDLGPIFDQKVEADFARTYVIGDDLEKLKLAAVLPKIFATCKRKYLYNPDQTGAEFYALVYKTCEEHGYKYGNHYCAHLLDEFSHKTKFGMEAVNFACPENLTPMSTPGAGGQPRFWVLEIHILQDPSIGIYGGFHEDLLNLPLPGEDFSV
ncbi:hypothetical protein WJX81_007776 [Elliptochloris bilobata]|uniref:Peptidase M24 domain-containing protein n=1 Tax=Elliptochloris bilobata TaxID=381761 RepID=A0AAW1RFS2_9CHLO